MMMQECKKVCVIGCGSSGLVLMKEMQCVGISFQCFEVMPKIGGVYAKSYENTILTTSSLLTAWSDHSDGKEKEPTFWTSDQYLEYLQSFAIKHDLSKHVTFNCNVRTVKKCPQTQKWIVTTCHNIASQLSGQKKNGTSATHEISQERIQIHEFDAVAVCAGTNTFSSLPVFSGQENFKGELLHSEKYGSPHRFAGKRVLIVGTGESGSDIANEVSKVAHSCAISIRGKHGHILPRIQCNGTVTDTNTNRCRYSNPYIVGDLIGYVNSLSKNLLATVQPDSEQKRVLMKINELNMLQKTSAFSKFGCKNEGFVRAMVARGAELHRSDFHIRSDRVVFQDGSEFYCDVILACTGYRNAFPYFEEAHPELVRAGQTPRQNFKQIFSIDYPGEVGFFGFARPAFGSIPPTTEMQARMWALVLSGQLTLPCTEKMRSVASQDAQEWEERFGYDAKRVKGLVDYQIYCDGLAKIMGVMPPLWDLFFSKPMLWLKVMCGPLTVHQYRLYGPYANPVLAEEVLMRHPLGDPLETLITAVFLLVCKLLYLLGFKSFKPNNF